MNILIVVQVALNLDLGRFSENSVMFHFRIYVLFTISYMIMGI